MKIKSIIIELELEEDDLQSHATKLTFENGLWSNNGPMYSRITPLLHEVWKTVKGMTGR